MKHLFVPIICFVVSAFPIFAQEQAGIEIPDSIRAFRVANIFQTEENAAGKPETNLIAVYGFDHRKNITYILDQKGLYFSHQYDSLNNLVSQYFYEETDSSGTKRIPSAKWIYSYSNGLRTQIDQYGFINGKWVLEDVVKNNYRIDQYGRIVENTYYVNDELKSSITYTYDSNQPEKQGYDFNRGWFTNHSCIKKVEQDARGKIISVSDFTYDLSGNCVLEIKEDLSDKHIKRRKRIEYNYSSAGLLLEEIVYVVVNGYGGDTYSVKRSFEYDDQGFEIKYTSKRPEEFGSVKTYTYLNK